MAFEPESVQQITQAISHSIAPAFVLGAMSAFISMLSSRVDVVLARLRNLNAIREENVEQAHLKQDTKRLMRRLRLLRRALLLSIAAGFFASLLIVIAFVLAILGIQHVWGVAVLFIIALSLFSAAIVTVGFDAVISISSYDQF